MRTMFRKPVVAMLAATAALTGLALTPSAEAAPLKTDFVFIIDASGSMAGEISGVRNGFGAFASSLSSATVDARFAVVLFGGEPELILDFTTDTTAVQNTLNAISTSGAVSGVHANHNANPEAGLEAIRMVLGAASNSVLANGNIPEDGTLNFRSDARKNLILATDEDSDRPFYTANRLSGQTSNEPPNSIAGTDWQAEVDATAQAAIRSQAFLNLLVGTDTPTYDQYGDFHQDVSDADLLNYDETATLNNLIASGHGDSLQAQVLAAGLVARTFDVQGANDTDFISNFFAAKLEEVTTDPGVTLPEPGTLALFGFSLVGLGLAARRRRG